MKRTRRSVHLIALVTFILHSTGAYASGGGHKEKAAPLRLTHPRFLRPSPPETSSPRVIIKNDECRIDAPVIPGERVVLTTIGVEHRVNGRTEFHPLLSVAVDQTFSEASHGQWLAVWNLGVKSPGLLSRMRALLPGFTARKRIRRKELRTLEKKRTHFSEAWRRGRVKPPRPYLVVTRRYPGSTFSLTSRGLTWILDAANVFNPGQLLFRNYLLRRKDYQERLFQQAYVGLLWYSELSTYGSEPTPLSLEAIQDMKFQLLANRRIFGRWIDPRVRGEFISQFENEMRDHLWGTSSYLASAANEYHLGYEEFHRYTPSGVPLALGGILYYDPALAPEPDQVKWPVVNPFDLTYNPFTDPAVQRAVKASPGAKIPLAVYVYQSNLALKPIIVVDFFRPNNPRLREAATYWRKLTNEILAVKDVGLLYNLLNRSLNFAANRKEITWFSDKKLALGIEELRLSLEAHLYFEPTVADELLDRIDRLLINPLVQPGRLQRLRAQLHYQALIADGGAEVLRVARRVRERLIRQVAGNRHRPLTAADYAAYRRYLRKQPYLRRLEVCLHDTHLSSIPEEQIIEALDVLATEADGHDEAAIELLTRLRSKLRREFRARQRGGRRIDWELNGLIARIGAVLEQLYRAAGKSPAQLARDLAERDHRLVEEAATIEVQWERRLTKRFTNRMHHELGFLRRFVKSGGDLTRFSPWYVARALNFFRQVPLAIDHLPSAAAIYRQQEATIRTVLTEVEKTLAAARSTEDIAWLSQQRFYCLRLARQAQATLVAFGRRPGASPGSAHSRDVP